jgi:hypothetical protein
MLLQYQVQTEHAMSIIVECANVKDIIDHERKRERTMQQLYEKLLIDILYIDADLLTIRLAVHMLRVLRYSIKIRATVSCHLSPFTCSRARC